MGGRSRDRNKHCRTATYLTQLRVNEACLLTPPSFLLMCPLAPSQVEITCCRNLLTKPFRNRAAVHICNIYVLSCPARLLLPAGTFEMKYEGSFCCFHRLNMRSTYLAAALKSQRSRAWQSKTQWAKQSNQSFRAKSWSSCVKMNAIEEVSRQI